MKLAGLGLKEYFADTFNWFDFVIVLVGVAELLFALGGGAGAGALRAFRLVRVLRAAKVFKSSRRARAFSEKLVLDVAAARDLACVALVFVFVFAILGMHIFGGAAPFGGRLLKDFDDVSGPSPSSTCSPPANGTTPPARWTPRGRPPRCTAADVRATSCSWTSCSPCWRSTSHGRRGRARARGARRGGCGPGRDAPRPTPRSEADARPRRGRRRGRRRRRACAAAARASSPRR